MAKPQTSYFVLLSFMMPPYEQVPHYPASKVFEKKLIIYTKYV